MNDFVEVLELQPVIDSFGIEYKELNFEVFYSRVAEDARYSDAARVIEQSIFSYFDSLRLPDEPTVYDHLVLSLRPKDVIASFNWDPFLHDAIVRNYAGTDMTPPLAVHLHGCVREGYCAAHSPIAVGDSRSRCPKCDSSYTPTRLLYPVTQKNYNHDAYSTAAWSVLRQALSDAYIFTVFGYGAPASDAEAISLLREAWGEPETRAFEQTEIIDIRNPDELAEAWNPFIHSHHYSCIKDFYGSWIALHPRRSCEAVWNMTMDLLPDEERPIPRDRTRADLHRWILPLIDQENTG